MAAPIVLTKTLAASSTNTIALAQVPVSGTALTINGASAAAGVATLDTARRVLLTFGNEAAPRTLVVSGTMEGGAAISESLVVPSGGAGTVATKQDFLTVTRAVPAGSGWSAAVTLGTNGVGSSRWVLADRHMKFPAIGVQVDFTGVANATIETTMDSFLAPLVIYAGGVPAPGIPTPVGWAGLTGLASAGGSQQGNITTPIAGWRLTVNSGTGSVTATGIPIGITD